MQALLYIIIMFSLFQCTIPHFSMHTNYHLGYATDQQALLAIKSKISQDPNMVVSSWNESIPMCEWRGITCGRRHRRVVRLDLSSSNMIGTLSPFVGNLSFLRKLLLYNNTFQGGIPTQIGHLSRLHLLALHNNSFEGEIPSNLSRCLHLNHLFLSSNKLSGKIPVELSSLPNLEWFLLSDNNLSGRLKEIGIMNMTRLEILSLERNQLEGSIPHDIGKLKGLTILALSENKLSGTIPSSLFNLSSLNVLYLDSIGVHGQLPQDLGILLPNLRSLSLECNYLSGHVPKSLSNLSNLEDFNISFNNFTGKFLFNGKNMQNLQWIVMVYAFTWGDKANDLSFIETLTNCSILTSLEVVMNDFGGVLPNVIVNLTTNLRFIGLGGNRISGNLPIGMSKFVNLYGLALNVNQFIGPIPSDIGELKDLEIADFSSNNFSGNIPYSLGNLSRLSDLRLNNNNLVGNIPSSLGNCRYLLRLYLFQNNISGVVPSHLFYASELVEVMINENNLQGSLPDEISNLKSLVTLDVSKNMFSGEIPSTIGGCTSLLGLYIEYNSFSGSIPQSLSSLKGIQDLNLSHNNLSGRIPSYFSELALSSLDLSFNNFEGEVPIKGIFANTTEVSLDGNKDLCGGVSELHLSKCPFRRKTKRRAMSFKMFKIIITTIVVVVLIIALFLALLLFYFLNSRRKMKSTSSRSLDIKIFLNVSYQTLWEATKGFSPSCLIGVGGFGSVYKGIIHQDDVEMCVTIKVMNLQNERANKSLIAECKALMNVRHRNLVKIITMCSSIDHHGIDFKALVYEFMPKGNLESWIHSIGFVDDENTNNQLHCLSLLQRVSIAIDVACAINYLHNECPTPIIHCDLKPSNILLDDEMIAHVSDFGLAKFLLGPSSTENQSNSSQVRGTVGYTPPEYGLGSKTSTEGDIYSFGIIVLELITSKKPVDPIFNEGLNLHDFAQSALTNRVMEIVDPKLIDEGNMWLARNNDDIRKIECIKSLIDIGIQCSLEAPQERMPIKNVVNQLKSAKQNLLGKRI